MSAALVPRGTPIAVIAPSHAYDPAKLEARIRHKGLDPADFRDYLKPFRYGMPPHGGFGLGIDRLTMEVLGLANVREAVLFPRDRNRLAP